MSRRPIVEEILLFDYCGHERSQMSSVPSEQPWRRSRPTRRSPRWRLSGAGKKRWAWGLAAISATFLPLVATAAVVGPDVMARTRDGRRTPVVVLIRDPVASVHHDAITGRRLAIGHTRESVLRSVATTEVELRRAFEVVPGFTAMVSRAGLQQLAAQPDVVRIDPDPEGSGALATSVPQIAADRVQARGIAGKGTVVAILDTGVDASHPDLQDALIHEECFCSQPCCPDGGSRQSGPGSAASHVDHGAHVAGILLSRGRVAAVGVAPEASVVAIRVLNDQNRGILSDWVAALDWIAANRRDVRVINMSLVSDALFEGECDASDAVNALFSAAVNLLYQRGTLVFAAAGNNANPGRLASPACIRNVLSVSSVTAKDEIALSGNSGANLDLLAPGVGIISDAVGGGLTTLSGTSMASPHAAGAATLLFSAQPGALAPMIESVLVSTGVPVRDVRNNKVTPRVSVLAGLIALEKETPMLRGGGSEDSDCLLEWNFLPADIAHDFPRNVAACTDGDGSCDADRVEGRCTFRFSLCFNMPDPRLPRCPTTEPLLWYEASVTPAHLCIGDCNEDGTVSVGEVIRAVSIALGSEVLATCPLADADGNDLVETNDLVAIVGNGLSGCAARRDLNAYVVDDSVPSFPIGGSICSVPVQIAVLRPPGGEERGVGSVRMSVQTQTRRDYDRVTLICEPATAGRLGP